MKFSLNAINLIVTGVMSAGVIGVTIAVIIDNNNSGPENSEATGKASIVGELESEETTESEPTSEIAEEPKPETTTPGTSTPNTPQKSETKVTASGSATADSHVSGGIHDSDSPNFVAYKYSYVGDFEDAFMGYCAKDVPSGMWSENLQPSVALGIKSVMDSATHHSMKGQMAYLFNTYVWEGGRMSSHLGNTYSFGPVEWFGIKTGYENQLFKPSMSFVITWSTRTISVTEPESQLPAEAIVAAKKWAEEATAYLRWLDSAYKAKCGNYTSLY